MSAAGAGADPGAAYGAGAAPGPPGSQGFLGSPAGSVWLMGQRTLTVQRRGRFVPESGRHPGRMSPDLAEEAIRRFTRPGDVVLDPMCGIGTTLVEAVHAGRHGVGVECEPVWAGIARDNIDLATRQGGTGSGVVVTGDARHLYDLTPTHATRGETTSGEAADPEQPGRAELGRLRGRVRLVLTSPPYGSSTHGRVEVPRGRDEPVVSHLFQHYTDQHADRSANGPAGRAGRPGRRGRVNLAHVTPAGLRAGMSEIFAGCLPLLAPGGLVVVTARPWRHRGLLVDLPGLVARAGQDASLELADRHVALLAARRADPHTDRLARLVPRHSFLQLLQALRARDRWDRWALIAMEDVLILRRPTAGHGVLPVASRPGDRE